jgi:two-component system, response regulator
MSHTMILVVEDNRDDSDLLTRQLTRAHIDGVYVIADGKDALDYLLRASPAPYAVFLDLRMPRLGGIDLLREIRRELRLYSLPVIIMTDSITSADTEICARLGVTAILPQPVPVELLRKIIDSAKNHRPFLFRSIDPHFADLASSVL